ncbi:MAG: MFS transporter, partial [Dehalococcoidia bacterium]|nr:MFS transporter [Dehalococcoidia bacterium]
MKYTPGEANSRKQPIFYGWLIVAVATVAMFASGPAQASVLSVFVDPIARELGWSRTLISGGVSVGTVLAAAAVVPTGPLLDRYGTRIVIPAAGALLGLAAIGMSLVTTPLSFYILMALIRFTGIGVLMMASTVAAANWFIHKRGRATAFTIVGMAAGIGVAPPVAQFIIQVYDWRTAWTVFGIAIWLLVVLPGVIFLRRRPEDMGLYTDGVEPGVGGDGEHPEVRKEPEWRFREVVRTRALWLLLPAVLVSGVTAGGVTFHQVPFLLGQGMSPLSAAGVVSLYALFVAAGSLLSGVAADRVPVRFGLVACLAAGGVAIVALLVAQPATIFLYSLLYGVSVGGRQTLEPVMWANYYGRSSLGTIRGVAWPVQIMGFAAGPVIAGMAYDLVGDYLWVFGVFAVSSLGSALLVLLAKP